MSTNGRTRRLARQTAQEARTLGRDIKDSFNELKHRTAAAGERTKRQIAGDVMTTGEKGVSFVKETGYRSAAAMDKTKRKLRDRLKRGK